MSPEAPSWAASAARTILGAACWPRSYQLRTISAAVSRPPEAERQPERQRDSADGRHEQGVDQGRGDPELVDGYDDAERPDQDPGHRSPACRVAEASLGRGAPHEALEGVGGKTGQHQDDQGDDQVREPEQQLLEHLRNGRQPERVEGDHERDQPDEPLGDHGDEAGRVSADAHLLDEAAEAGAGGQIVEADRPQQGGDGRGDGAGDEPADDDDDDEADSAGDDPQEHREGSRS